VTADPPPDHGTVGAAVTALFVPGDRPDRFGKADRAGADLVILDLEDAVAPGARADALAATVTLLTTTVLATPHLVRVNAIGTATHDDEVDRITDLLASGVSPGLAGIVLPKAEDAGAVADLAARLLRARPGASVVPVVESAAGLLAAAGIGAAAGVSRIAFGAIDFALDLGVDAFSHVVDHARAHLVVTSRATGRPGLLDSPATDIADLEAVAASARRARSFGCTGKLCIHPAQVPVVRAAFRPSPDELAWARSVVGTGGAAAQVDGRMVDRPVLARAQALLAAADRS
jgi:citrate lyase subunit beta/citryl-CoA lyase